MIGNSPAPSPTKLPESSEPVSLAVKNDNEEKTNAEQLSNLVQLSTEDTVKHLEPEHHSGDEVKYEQVKTVLYFLR